MRHIITFSGGKDSLATLIWAKRNLPEFEVVFCDTGWESEQTYEHIQEVQRWFDLKFITLSMNGGGNDFVDLVKKKKRSPSTNSRFCTEFLKINPLIDYILTIEDDVKVYQGIRADESPARRKMNIEDEYFKGYFIPRGKRTDWYRKKEIVARCDRYTTDVFRPIFLLTANDVFDEIKRFGLTPNPLYYEGFGRVGCFPCIMCNHAEIRLIAEKYPHRIDMIRRLEEEAKTTFFGFEYIPERFCTKIIQHRVDLDGLTPKEIANYRQVNLVQTDEDGEFVNVPKRCPTIDDVVKYLQAGNAPKLFGRAPCESIYNICE